MTEWDNPTFHEGRRWGRMEERERIIKLLEGQIRECECSSVGMRYCRHKTVFVPDLIALIKGEEK